MALCQDKLSCVRTMGCHRAQGGELKPSALRSVYHGKCRHSLCCHYYSPRELGALEEGFAFWEVESTLFLSGFSKETKVEKREGAIKGF